ncbi:MAG: NAD(P)-dependent oxidoreductase [Chloroflexi bacterium]|nr:NAD(P)-dependent oxidoreductase [Chloroflexota bacterium]MBT6681789.1 NAD(P)-dependent oxidoreductase [Chloroflexota bacterium]
MAKLRNVLITGGAGLIGEVLNKNLSDRYSLSSLDLRESAGMPSFVADLSDLDAIAPAFEGQHTVVHLAADRRAYSDWSSTLDNNIVSTYNVFEAAKRAGVKRVIFASSNHSQGGFYLDAPWKHVAAGEFDKLEPGYRLVDEDDRIRPDGYYGVSKAFGEAIGSYYDDYHGISSIHLRIGWVISDDDPTFSPFALSLWLSHRDTAQAVAKAIDAPESLRYAITYVTSDNKWKIFSIDRAREILGYEPEDAAGSDWEDRDPPVRDR